MSNIVLSQVSKIASAFNMQDVDPAELANTLVNTVFKKATNDEFLSLLIVANQYKLNPFTKEIYAFPAKGGGITPVVGIDGWARIINDNPVCDGIQFEQD
ncbi:recT family protein, partial [Acinetobacter sp. 25977_10]